jgi:alpha-L-fucosidase
MMRRRDLLRNGALAPLALAASRRAFGQQNRYPPTWEALDRRPSPSWYPAAKFGIFIHWGVYSVPAYAAVNVKDENPYAEWYWNSLTEGTKATAPAGHGTMTWKFHQRMYGANFPYFDFAPLFRAEFYDPNRWADVFVRSGAKYVALTSKHHEGFTLWHSAEANRAWGRPWNSVDIGPRRDLLLDLMEAGRRRDLRMGIYYSLYEWYNPLWLGDRRRYAVEHMFPQFKDVVTHAKPSIIFADGEWELTSAEWRAPELLEWLFNESPVRDEVVINDRWGKETRHHHGGYFTTEYTPGMTQSDHPWEENRGMGYSYGYNRMESLADYRTDRELLMMLIDIVSRGGNLLLDIGPTGDGRIPVIMEERLIHIGDWLRPNGEAIYNTRARKVTRQWSQGKVPQLEEKDFMSDYPIGSLVDSPAAGFARVEAFFTAGDSAVYAILPRRPLKEVVLDGIVAPSGVRVTLLEGGQPLESARHGSQLRIRIPDALAASLPARQAYVLKIAGAR